MFKHQRFIIFLLISLVAMPTLAQQHVNSNAQEVSNNDQFTQETQPKKPVSEKSKKEDRKSLWDRIKKGFNLKSLIAATTLTALGVTFLLLRRKPTEQLPTLPAEVRLTIFLQNANTIPEITKEIQRFKVTFKDAPQIFASDKAKPIIKEKVKKAIDRIKKQFARSSFKTCSIPEMDQYPYYDLNVQINGQTLLEHVIKKFSYEPNDRVGYSREYLNKLNVGLNVAEDIELIKMLVDEGADINATDTVGSNSYDYAYRRYMQNWDSYWAERYSFEPNAREYIEKMAKEHHVISILLEKKVRINWNHSFLVSETPLKHMRQPAQLQRLLTFYGYLGEDASGRKIYYETPQKAK